METRGKSINLFLMDGTASGRIKATLANWTEVSYKIPRTEMDKCKNREDLRLPIIPLVQLRSVIWSTISINER